uniref:C3H1-type domain-containing protein n=1 Tax=Neobodo designis TaxID=312471 RepID=A0A7S1PKA0_NEODS|mmetsp:Transcript_11346/g.35273  ORF Transcript_11346/g.35273 Transcript_11346/m.35273 type:complete len:295 (+) Transcript_11346:190-1074(+)|eukprot:CAMPEP_0174840646 /NCGR_PEP_ID=MMETSP1114-20130205/8803_1 /TAXON_ID=312471 /ORGANISM="Neobodo designis, Strain CCAP 1951/1" /LENGTH=294 /DNA_ID=CAMNT_0016074805 /DNA_START=190 /DNA_END=1074 /DNA_ORIENTATION=+
MSSGYRRRSQQHQRLHARDRARPNEAVLLPCADVCHVPAAPPAATRKRGGRHHGQPPLAPPFLCPMFAEPAGCPHGDACPDVHADLRRALRIERHLHPRVVGTADGPAGCPPPAQATYAATLGDFAIAPPNERVATLAVRAEACLVTAAVSADGAPACRTRPLTTCIHFTQRGACDFGATCQFVHALEPPRPCAALSVSTPAMIGAAFSASSVSIAAAGSRNGRRPMLPPLAGAALTCADPGTSLLSAPAEATGAASSPRSQNSLAATTPRRRFRHEPYGAHGWVAAAVRASQP